MVPVLNELARSLLKDYSLFHFQYCNRILNGLELDKVRGPLVEHAIKLCEMLTYDKPYINAGQPGSSCLIDGYKESISRPNGNGEAYMYAIIRLLRTIEPNGVYLSDHWDLLSETHAAKLRDFIANNGGHGESLLTQHLNFVLQEGIDHHDLYFNPRECARDVYFHGKIAIWLLNRNCVDVARAFLSANLTSGQVVQAICSQMKAAEEHVAGRPTTANEEIRAEQMIWVIEDARAALLYCSTGPVDRPVKREQGLPVEILETVPIQRLNGWTEITVALGLPDDEETRRRLRRYSKDNDGPLHGRGKGSKPQLINNAALIAWWNAVKNLGEHATEQREQQEINRDAAAANTLNYGRDGNVMPDLAGQQVSKLRQIAKPRRHKKSSTK